MRRRDFIAGVGSAAAWPVVARGQQRALPVVGVLHATSSYYFAQFSEAVRQGMRESGVIEGQDATIEYRWAEGQNDRLPALAADLVRKRVAVILAIGGTAPALAAKATTSTVPIVFLSAADPVKAGLVDSLNRPGANVTGISFLGAALEAKRLEILHKLVPGVALIGALVDPTYPDSEAQRRELRDAADILKQPIALIDASTPAEINKAFATLSEKNAGAVLVTQAIFFNTRGEQLAGLAARYRLPAIFDQREIAALGGLITYGTSFRDGYRLGGVYVGRVLRGTKPVDLPVLQPTKFESVINLKTAQALGLTIPETLLATADEVIQ
jgi:putative tryptophan/tyrosine transport system substrate-binding protein